MEDKEKRKARNRRYRLKRKEKLRKALEPSEMEKTIARTCLKGVLGIEDSRMGENKSGWVSICSNCGAPLDKKGRCPNCQPDEESQAVQRQRNVSLGQEE